MTESAILYDASKCSACKGCQVQCKQWNMMPSSLGMNENEFTGSYQSMPNLNGDTRLLIEFREEAENDEIQWAFSRRACWHCTEPTCMEVCPVGAISKHDDGVVKIDRDICIGCKYCNAACPFEVPKYREHFNISNKCTMCDDRLAQGREPACVKTCPAAALRFGPRDEMVSEAKARVDELRTAGYDKAELYGENEMGGLHSLFVAKYGLEAHGLTRDPQRPDAVALFNIIKPFAGIGIAAVVGGLGLSLLSGIGYSRDDELAHDDPPADKTVKEEE